MWNATDWKSSGVVKHKFCVPNYIIKGRKKHAVSAEEANQRHFNLKRQKNLLLQSIISKFKSIYVIQNILIKIW